MDNHLPLFPIFKKLTLEDKKHIDSFLKSLPPYSDFLFSSLWCWNTKLQIEFSILNNNLVLKMPDYISNEIFITFVGSNNIEDTIDTLLKHGKDAGLKEVLKLLPEHNFQKEDLTKLQSKYNITEDRNNFDYILSIDNLVTMAGLYNKKNKVNQFQKKHQYKIKIEDLKDAAVQDKIFTFVKNWFESSKNPNATNENELAALRKLLDYAHSLHPQVICLYVEDKLIGFSIFEIFSNNYAIHAFQKGLHEYKGVYEFLYFQMAHYLKKQGCLYLNIEQDLGIEGLRRAKLDYNPSFLKKYTITHKKSPD